MKNLKKAMMISISEVFETMFYLPLEIESSDAVKINEILDAENILACQLDFNGGFSGRFTLFIPRELAVLMTENFMAEKRENIGDDHLDQMTKEIINMVAGNTFSHLDDRVEFKLSIPQPISAPDMTDYKPVSESEEFIWVETTDGCLAFKVSTDT